MALWSAWLPDVAPHVAGCPAVVVVHEVRRAAQAFFERTYAWKVTEAPLPVLAGATTVEVVPADAGQDLVRVEEAWYDGKPLDILTPEEMAGNFEDDWQAHTGVPHTLIQDGPGDLRLYPIPVEAAAIGLKLRISVRPSATATGIPDKFKTKYLDEISSGAKARLLMYSNKPWTDLALGAAMALAFDAGIAKANYDAATAFGKSRITSRPSWC